MVARIWNGKVPNLKANEYLELMRRIAIPDYLAIEGNRGAWCLSRQEKEVAHVLMLTYWESVEAIKRFAGSDYTVAKYYAFDQEYLVEMEPHVLHFEVSSGTWPFNAQADAIQAQGRPLDISKTSNRD